MENETTYTAIAYNHAAIGRLISVDIYKTASKVVESNDSLVMPTQSIIGGFSMPFDETVEKDKTYYLNGYGERAFAINRTTPMEALRDAFDCLTRKRPTEFEPHYLQMAMGKIINTLRLMYRDDSISNVSFAMRQDQTYLLVYRKTPDDVTTVHNGFR
jgi:hypothetical protein